MSEQKKEFKLSANIAAGVRSAIQRVNALETEACAARASADAAVAVHQQYLSALIKDAGFVPEDFSNHGLVERDGEFYLMARE